MIESRRVLAHLTAKDNVADLIDIVIVRDRIAVLISLFCLCGCIPWHCTTLVLEVFPLLLTGSD